MQEHVFLLQMLNYFSSTCACKFCGHNRKSQVWSVPGHHSSTAFLQFPMPLILILSSIFKTVFNLCVLLTLSMLGTIPALWSAGPVTASFHLVMFQGLVQLLTAFLFPSFYLLNESSVQSAILSMALVIWLHGNTTWSY